MADAQLAVTVLVGPLLDRLARENGWRSRGQRGSAWSIEVGEGGARKRITVSVEESTESGAGPGMLRFLVHRPSETFENGHVVIRPPVDFHRRIDTNREQQEVMANLEAYVRRFIASVSRA